MLSRTASSLYWLGRYIERAEFVARLVEATLRYDALSPRDSSESAWATALDVLGLDEAYAATGAPLEQEPVTRFLTIDASHAGSVIQCLDAARDNARAVRTALSRDAWSAINRAWLLFHGKNSPGDTIEALALVERAEVETRACEGAIGRMLRNPSALFLRLGAAVERGECSTRLLRAVQDRVPADPQAIASHTERDMWQMVLKALSAVNAYRWVYREGLQPTRVVELILLRRELPRSLIACADEAVHHLNTLGKQTGLQGEADRWARRYLSMLSEARLDAVTASGLGAFLNECMATSHSLDRAITRQFRFH